MDGSAKIFMETLQKAKIKKLNKRRKYLKVTDYFNLMIELEKFQLKVTEVWKCNSN